MIRDLVGPIKVIRAQSKAAYPYCHCLYVDGETRAVFDTGAGVRSLAGLDTQSIDLVIYSHYHPDHTHGHELFAGARYCIHALDYPAMVSREDYLYFSGVHMWEKLMSEPKLEYGAMMRQLHPDPDFPDVSVRPKRIDMTFQDGYTFDFGTTKATVIHTPGHSPGHCCFFFEREGVLFSGDIDLIPFGPWYGSYLANVDDFLASIEKLKILEPSAVVSCHRRYLTENITAELEAFREKILEREAKVLKCLSAPRTLDELACCHIIYEQHFHPYYLFWEKMMILKHLERLERMRVVNTDGERWFIET